VLVRFRGSFSCLGREEVEFSNPLVTGRIKSFDGEWFVRSMTSAVKELKYNKQTWSE